MKRRLGVLVAAGVLCGAGTGPQEQPSEYEAKAAWLENFCKFVYWPKKVWANGDGDYSIGLLGDDDFGQHLKNLNGKSVGDRKIRTLRRKSVKDLDDLLGCKIIFVSKSEKANYREIREAVKGRPILLVGETKGFAQDGGMIGFFPREKNKLGFFVNKKVADHVGLRFSPRMLQLIRPYLLE